MRSRFECALQTLSLCACAVFCAACSSSPPDGQIPASESPPATAGFLRYSDIQVQNWMSGHPGLTTQFEPDPDDLLANAGIHLAGLEQVDRVVGDCICQTTYDLSPGYELIVDQNACFGYDVFIRKKPR